MYYKQVQQERVQGSLPQDVTELLLSEFKCYPIYGRILMERVNKNIVRFGDRDDPDVIALKKTMNRVSKTFFNPQPIIRSLERDGDIEALSPCWKAFLKSAVTADYWYLVARAELGRFTGIPEQQTKEFQMGYMGIARRVFGAYEAVSDGLVDGMWPFPHPIPPKNSQELFYITDAFWIQNLLAELNRRTMGVECGKVINLMRNAISWPNTDKFLMDYMSSAYLDVNLHQTVPIPLMIKIVGLSCAETNADFVDAIAFKKETEFLLGDIFKVPESVRQGFLKGERALIRDTRGFIKKLKEVPTW